MPYVSTSQSSLTTGKLILAILPDVSPVFSEQAVKSFIFFGSQYTHKYGICTKSQFIDGLKDSMTKSVYSMQDRTQQIDDLRFLRSLAKNR